MPLICSRSNWSVVSKSLSDYRMVRSALGRLPDYNFRHVLATYACTASEFLFPRLAINIGLSLEICYETELHGERYVRAR